MVAAWMSADTGVGPSMASGSHVCSGSWADLAIAPTSSRNPISSSVPLSVFGSAPKTPRYVVWWNVAKIAMAARIRPTSPITFMTNALRAATTALCRQ